MGGRGDTRSEKLESWPSRLGLEVRPEVRNENEEGASRQGSEV